MGETCVICRRSRSIRYLQKQSGKLRFRDAFSVPRGRWDPGEAGGGMADSHLRVGSACSRAARRDGRVPLPAPARATGTAGRHSSLIPPCQQKGFGVVPPALTWDPPSPQDCWTPECFFLLSNQEGPALQKSPGGLCWPGWHPQGVLLPDLAIPGYISQPSPSFPRQRGLDTPSSATGVWPHERQTQQSPEPLQKHRKHVSRCPVRFL